MKKLMYGAALSALLLSGALAQSPTTPANSGASSSPPAAAEKTPSPSAATQNTPGSGKADFVAAQKPDQWLASKFKGTGVVGSDNQKIGDVTDILFDKSGKIEAYVIGVGGFLGMGAKDVALAPSSFDVVPGQNGNASKLKLSLSKEQLQQAQNFAPYQPPRPTTTGAAPGGGLNSLSGGSKHPATNTPPTGK